MDVIINIDVDDLAKAVAFYERALGLRAGRRLGETAIEMIGGTSQIWLLLKARGTRLTDLSTSVRDYTRHWTPIHLDFVVDDMERDVSRAIAAGATLEGEIRAHDWGRIAQLADPFGHGLCLIQFRGRGYDEVAS